MSEDVDDGDGSTNGVLITEVVEEVLADEPRPGTPPTFTPEQVVRIVALACEDPREESGRPITHWSTPELADEAVKRGIVESISARSVGRFLGRGGSEAPSDALLAKQRASGKEPEVFDREVRSVCEYYADALRLHEEGVHLVSTDEKTSIQALERLHPALPMRAGQVERQEHEYKRHGTRCFVRQLRGGNRQDDSPLHRTEPHQ